MSVRVLDQSHPFSNINFLELSSGSLGFTKKLKSEEIKEADELNEEPNISISKQSVGSNFNQSQGQGGKNFKRKNMMDNYDASLMEIENKRKGLNVEISKYKTDSVIQGNSKKDSIQLLKSEPRIELDLKETNNEILVKNVITLTYLHLIFRWRTSTEKL
jgi:hypothetical protein